MAIRANWPQVLNRVQTILAISKGNWFEMMNMDEVLANFPVFLLKQNVADRTPIAVVSQARLSRSWITLVGVHPNLFSRPFRVLAAKLQFIREETLALTNESSRFLLESSHPFNRLLDFFWGEKRLKQCLLDDCFQGEIRTTRGKERIKSFTLSSVSLLQHPLSRGKTTVLPDRLKETSSSIADFLT